MKRGIVGERVGREGDRAGRDRGREGGRGGERSGERELQTHLGEASLDSVLLQQGLELVVCALKGEGVGVGVGVTEDQGVREALLSPTRF